jgi:hypothetical protein
MSMKRETLCNIITAAATLLLSIPIAIMLSYRVQPVTISGGYITPSTVHAGDTIRITWTATEHRACDGYIIQRVIDSLGYIHEMERTPTVYHETLDHGGRTFQKLLTLPLHMAPGPAIYSPVVYRWCNPLQKWLWPIPADIPKIMFNVTER